MEICQNYYFAPPPKKYPSPEEGAAGIHPKGKKGKEKKEGSRIVAIMAELGLRETDRENQWQEVQMKVNFK